MIDLLDLSAGHSLVVILADSLFRAGNHKALVILLVAGLRWYNFLRLSGTVDVF